MKINILTGCLLILLFACSSEDKVNVKIVLESPELEADTEVYITGNDSLLGNWNPGKVKMKAKGNGQWEKTVAVLPETPLAFKFTLGSWEREGADANGQPLPDNSLKVHADTSVSYAVNFWRNGEKIPVEGQVTGIVKYHKAVRGKGLQPRDLIVWLPPNYDDEEGKNYPVLYMHDGQNIFDPNTASFKVDWRVDETADSLIRRELIEPIIIVGIYNTTDRSKEYIPGKKGTAYMDFVVNTVKPMIDEKYRTLPDREHTATGGSSAGGIISFMLMWEYNEVFSKAICMSPAFKIQDIDFVDDVLDYTGPQKDIKVYIDNGGVELEEKLQPGVDEMLKALKSKGYKEGEDFWWRHDPKAKHFESAWAKRMPDALEVLFRK
ncbi:alpha/beta hydrolase-fold protein [Limibacter armeniacum]|uniref:alpha/beta hydrolase-fold protein n=1 Tax=Limibacter armeniacum TaxID=466084 RepID=UPI002FE6B133